MTGLDPVAIKVRRSMVIRAGYITAVVSVGGLFYGSLSWAVGTSIGYFVAVGNLFLMTTSLGRALGQGAWGARGIYLFFSFIRLFFLAGLMLLSLKWKLELGLGFCAGLLTVMLAAGSALLSPFKTDQTQRKGP